MPNNHKNEAPKGAVLLALLLTLALMGIALTGAANWWSLQHQRENEEDLLFVGNQYRQALERYYYASPSTARRLPTRLDELLEDRRFPLPVRHLRRLYLDPLTGNPFESIRLGEQILGVVSTSKNTPIKRSGFYPPYSGFEGAENYAQWKFEFIPRRGRKSLSPTSNTVISPALIGGELQ